MRCAREGFNQTLSAEHDRPSTSEVANELDAVVHLCLRALPVLVGVEPRAYPRMDHVVWVSAFQTLFLEMRLRILYDVVDEPFQLCAREFAAFVFILRVEELVNGLLALFVVMANVFKKLLGVGGFSMALPHDVSRLRMQQSHERR